MATTPTWHKSSFSGSGDTGAGNCVEVAFLPWRKSSFSGDGGVGGGDCVEAALLPAGRFALRDSKNPGVTLNFPRLAMRAFVAGCGETPVVSR
jgi:Domain of unknown function (DUF397)